MFWSSGSRPLGHVVGRAGWQCGYAVGGHDGTKHRISMAQWHGGQRLGAVQLPSSLCRRAALARKGWCCSWWMAMVRVGGPRCRPPSSPECRTQRRDWH